MNMRNNKKGGMGKHRGGRRYHGGGGGGGHSSGGGGNRNDGQNLARQKHHAMQMREKYQNMARDAQMSGDRVDVEYFLQHVDHYTRVLADINVIEGERQAQFREQQAAQQAANGGDQGGDNNANNGGGDDAGNTGGGNDEPIVQGNQPRMTSRQPRHQPREIDPNANKTEIPLPDSILPAI